VDIQGAGTSTFDAGLNVAQLNTTSGTSTFANGIELSAGCFRLPDGTCAGIGSGGSVDYLTDNNPHVILTDLTDRFGIGTNTPGTALSVQDEASIGWLSVEDQIRTGNIIATGTVTVLSSSTSTIPALSVTDIAVTSITLTGTLEVETSGTSTFAGGINLSAGCVALNGTCITGGGGSGGAFTSSGGNTTMNTSTDLLGIATSVPYAKVAIEISAEVNQDTPALVVQDEGTGTPAILIDYRGYTGFATATPWGGVSVEILASGSEDEFPSFVVGDTGTSAPALAVYSSGVTRIDRLETGVMNFDTNAGAVTWWDLPVTSAASINAAESYTAQIDGVNILTIYAQSNGDGGIQREAVGIGTTTPYGTLAIDNGTVGSTTPALLINANGTGDGLIAINVDAADTCKDSSAAATCSLNDLAESFPSSDDELGAGDLTMFVLADGKPATLQRATQENRGKLAGVISTSPAVVFQGSSVKTLGGVYEEREGRVPLTLAGRVPVKINLEGGAIHVGDPITVSSAAGVGMKSNSPGQIVGYAMEDISDLGGESSKKIIILADLGYWMGFNPSELSVSTEQESLLAQLVGLVMDILEDAFVKMQELVVGKLKVGNADKPSGITIFDLETRQPYCVVVRGGNIDRIPGECTFEVPSESSNDQAQIQNETQNQKG